MKNKNELDKEELNEIAGGGTIPIVEVQRCPWCNKNILKNDFEEHELKCPERKVPKPKF